MQPLTAEDFGHNSGALNYLRGIPAIPMKTNILGDGGEGGYPIPHQHKRAERLVAVDGPVVTDRRSSSRLWGDRMNRSFAFRCVGVVLLTQRFWASEWRRFRRPVFVNRGSTSALPVQHSEWNSWPLPDVPGRTHGEDAFIATGEKHPFQQMGTLIVEQVFVPFVLDELRYDHDDIASRMFFRKIENELHDGNNDEAVRRRQNMELGRLLAGRAERLLNVAFPFLLQHLVVLGGRNVQRDDFRGEPGSKFNSLTGDIAPAVDDNDRDGRLAETRHVNRILAGREQPDHVVVAADKNEDDNRQRNDQQSNPCALQELRK